MLTLIQGDVFEFCIRLGYKIDPYAVKSVEFISKDLNFRQRAFLEDGAYRVRVEGRVTRRFPVGFSRYDVVLTLIDGETVTVKSERLEVLKRQSEVRNE